MLLVASGFNWASFGDQSIVAMPKNQRMPGRIVIEIGNLADEDHVIATLISVGHLAFEDRERIGQDRTAGLPGLIVDAGPFVVERTGKTARYVLLALAQHVDREVIGREVRL